MVFLTSTPFRYTAFASACLLAIVIAYLSLLPGTDLPQMSHKDKLAHFLAYAALSGPMLVAFGARRWAAVIIGCSLYGVALEIGQSLAGTGRDASLLDGLANMAGAAAGVMFAAAILQLARPRQPR